MANKTILTEKEIKQYEDQLAQINRDIEENTRALKEAREQGDLSENADYSAAKEKQSILASEKQKVEEILKNYVKADVDKSDKVSIGKVVTIAYCGPDGDCEEKYLISSSVASDILNGKLSTDSPIGKALVGRKKGEVVHVQTPSGMLEVKIINVEVEN